MTFITFGFALAGLAAVSVPIIIHLLSRQRRRPIEWAAMRFLLEAFRKHRRRLQVEQIILLAVRCLILALLGFALARPILEKTGLIDGDSNRVVLLVVDNGLASAVVDADGVTALDRHKQQAEQVVGSLSPAEAVGLVLAARPAEGLVLPPTHNHDAVLDLLEALEPSEAPSDIPDALRLVREGMDDAQAEGAAVVAYLFSEFREGSAPLDLPLTERFDRDDERITLLAPAPASDPAPNVQVDSVEPVRRLILPRATDGSRQVSVSLSRHGGVLGRQSSRVRLLGTGFLPVEPKIVEWSPGQAVASIDFLLEFDGVIDRQLGLTALVDTPDSLAIDNSRHVIVEVRDRVRVAMVSPPTFGRVGLIEKLTPGQWIRRALAPTESSPMEVVDVDPSGLDDVDLRSVDVAVVTRPDRLAPEGWSALRGFVDHGGVVLLTPPAEINVHPWTDQLSTTMGLPWRVGLEVVDYPAPSGMHMADEQPSSELLKLLANELTILTPAIVANRILPIDADETLAERVLLFADGSPMMIAGAPLPDDSDDEAETTSRGLVVYLAVAPELVNWTNLPSQPLVVPLFQETVRQGLNLVRAAQRISVGTAPSFRSVARSADQLIAPDESRIELDRSGRPLEPLARSGVYGVLDPAGQPLGVAAINIETSAGRTGIQADSAVSAWLDDAGKWSTFDPADPANVLASVDAGSPIAGILLILVLVLALFETLIARRFSHAYKTGIGGVLQGGLAPTLEEQHGAVGGSAT